MLINNFYQIGVSTNLNFLLENVILVLLLSIVSILIKRFNVITLILSIEIIIISLVLLLIGLYVIIEDVSIEVYILYILGILAVETGIILSIIIKYYQITRESSLETIKNIKG